METGRHTLDLGQGCRARSDSFQVKDPLVDSIRKREQAGSSVAHVRAGARGGGEDRSSWWMC